MPIVPSSIQVIEAREKQVVVSIDGDEAIFPPSLTAGGKEGGHEATSPPPPGLPHPSSPGIDRPAIIQNVEENPVPVRRGSYPGTLNRNVIEGTTSYKSAVQGGGFCGSYGFVKSTANPIRGPHSPPQSEYSEGTGMSGNDHGAPSRINPNIVELIKPLHSPWKWD